MSPISRSLAGCRRCDRSCTLLAMARARCSSSAAAASVGPWAAPRSSSRSISRTRHLLADVVVEVPCEACALGLLRVEQTRGEIADPIVAPLQRRLASAHLRFRLMAPRPLHEQPGNERRLRQHDGDRRQEIRPKALPGAGGAKPDGGPGGNARLADVPALQLTPVHLIAVQHWCFDGNLLGALAVEDTQRQLADSLGLKALILHETANDTVVHCRVYPAVHGRVRRPHDLVERFQRIEFVFAPSRYNITYTRSSGPARRRASPATRPSANRTNM